MFLPTTPEEIQRLGWDRLDVVLVTGDSYIDSPYIGAAVIGKFLLRAGFRVGIIAQPDRRAENDIRRLGEPALFWGVSGGSVDSMVANYTASGKRRRTDDFTPGGRNDRRPDRAVIAYANLIRQAFKNTRPIVLGGIEASLRRIAHYDFWSDKVRKSILVDAKADYLVYGMGEKAALELALALKEGRDPRPLDGICYLSAEKPPESEELPSFREASADKEAFIRMFSRFYRNSDPMTARGICQKQDTRYLVQNRPAPLPTQAELDHIFALDFERDLHPFYGSLGKVGALETIRFSITTHRGCYGECNFCAIAVHQGRTVVWRGRESILAEARLLTRLPGFKGYILDVGGPTADMYGFECRKKRNRGSCRERRCLFPDVCPNLPVDHRKQIALLRDLRKIAGVRKVFVASGIRPDLVLADAGHGISYLEEVTRHHVSGQLKIAPEHSEDHVLTHMGKPGKKEVIAFRKAFMALSKAAGKEQYLTYYLIAAHPGCTEADMKRLRQFATRQLGLRPEQVQIFTPTPSTFSSLMYHTGIDPFTGRELFVERSPRKRERQKEILFER